MATELVGIVVNDVGNPVLPIGNPAGSKAFFRLFFDTPTGMKLAPFMSQEVEFRIEKIIKSRFGDTKEITLDQFSTLVEQLLRVRDTSIFPIEDPVSAEPADERERNADGRFKSEFQTWSESHSSSECTERARQHAAYRLWRQDQYRAEAIQDGTFRIAGTPERSAMSDERDSLADFVKAYNAALAANTRPRGGFVVLDETHKYSVNEFEQLLSRSSRIGLL